MKKSRFCSEEVGFRGLEVAVLEQVCEGGLVVEGSDLGSGICKVSVVRPRSWW